MNPKNIPGVFISYSHRDEEWKSRLLAHMDVLRQRGSYEVWSDRMIEAGAEWHERIRQSLDAARVAILLISPSYLASRFILNEEVSRFLVPSSKKDLLVVPVIIKPCAWESIDWLRKTQVFPHDGMPLSLKSFDEVELSLSELILRVYSYLGEERPATQHRGGAAPSANVRVSVGRLAVVETRLFGRERELRMLDEAWSSFDINVFSLVGSGGVGKSTLIGHWLSRLAQDDYRGARNVYGWSFYSQSAKERPAVSADLFIDSALRWFGDPDPTRGSPWDKGERLAHFVTAQRTLLILDGLELLQHNQGPHADELKEQSLQALLRGLAANNRGMCLITSRRPVRDLAEFEGRTTHVLSIAALAPDAGAQVLRSLGVTGDEKELEQASRDLGGNVLALTLLGSYLREVYDGDIHRRAEVYSTDEEYPSGDSANRVLASYVKRLGEGPELNVLRIIGLGDRPMGRETLAALRAKPAIRGLTDALQHLSAAKWSSVLDRLRRAKLLSDPAPYLPDALDAHPLVRKFFSESLKRDYPDAWYEGSNRLYEYFKRTAKEFPDTIEEMSPLYEAVTYGCQAGRYEEALLNLYWPRIQRGREFFHTNKLGAYGADLMVLSNFFQTPWTSPVEQLDEPWSAFVMNAAGFDLLAVGQPLEAAGPMEVGVRRSIELADWDNAAVGARNLSEVYQTIGELHVALQYARQSIALADRSGSFMGRVVCRTSLGSSLHQAGRLEEADAAFREAERIQNASQPELPLLYSVRGYEFCDLLLTRGLYLEAQSRASQTIEIARRNALPLDTALYSLLIGRSLMLQALTGSGRDIAAAGEHLWSAVDGLRAAGRLDYLSLGLLARADFLRVTGKLDAAQEDITEAMNIARRGSMGLRTADCHLSLARLNLTRDEKERAREHWQKAREMIERMDYHRRDEELKELEAML
jgi:tetratricopeptide (TPR) repeat protein